jgi:hypothetical protein
MNLRRAETGLARSTLGGLIIYVPLETVASLPAPWDPFYLVDLIGMVLLSTGTFQSLRARPATAPGLLCAGYAWTGANFWRAFWGRMEEVGQGGSLTYGSAELWVVGVGTAVVMGCLALSLLLVFRSRHGNAAQ